MRFSFAPYPCVCAALLAAASILFPPPAYAAQVTITAAALERTLQTQLFAGPDGRYYLKGRLGHGCSVTAADPHLSFAGDRILLRLHAVAQLGRSVAAECVGIHLAEDVDVSMLPVAQGESVNFTDVRIERLSGSRELDFLLKPFLSRKIPSTLHVNVATLLRKLVSNSTETTGYAMSLDRFEVQSVRVDGDRIVVAVDGDLSVQ